MGKLTAAVLFFAAAALGATVWSLAALDSTASLRGIHNTGGDVIWASGADGTILRSQDGGYMWQNCRTLPEMAKLDFRAVVAWDANHAQAMSSGTGGASKLYETNDGGLTWRLLFANPDAHGFWDTLAYSSKAGYILGDAVDGHFMFYATTDGGRHWTRDRSAGLAVATGGESAFAASNSSLTVLDDDVVLFGSGGVGGPHVFRRDGVGRWSTAAVPVTGHKESAGVFSLAFRDNKRGIAVGGDYQLPNEAAGTSAWTDDGGLTWHPAAKPPSGYRSAVGWGPKYKCWIAVGTNGTDISRDDGRTWQHVDSASWNALSLPWAAGSKGRIASIAGL